MKQLILVRHGRTPATERRAFGADESLTEPSLSDAAALAAVLAHRGQNCRLKALSSPARRALQTASAAGFSAQIEPRLAECDFGSWSGKTLDELDQSAVAAWMTDPDAAPHGGESLGSFSERVREWLDDQAREDGSVVAFTHAGVIKAAVVAALQAAPLASWQVAVDPLSITELRADDGIWTLVRVNARSLA